MCGSVASAILIAYYDDFHSELGDFAYDWKKTSGEGVEHEYGKPLVKELVAYIEPTGNGSIFLNPGVSAYLEVHGIDGGVSMGALSVYYQTQNSIKSNGSGNPLIIGLSDHYCVGIGYKNISAKQILVNTGWGHDLWIDASTVICTWTMTFN